MSNVTLPTYYQQFIHKSRYARWLDDIGRREEWHETVSRYMDFMKKTLKEKQGYKIPAKIFDEVFVAIGDNPAKKYLFTKEERTKMAQI